VAVLGRSGIGKSVLLKLLIRLETPDSGWIRILGEEITTLERDRLNGVRKRMGFLFQQAALYDSLSVEENVAFPLRNRTEFSPTDRRERARELLASVGMERDLEKLPSEISGGMQKRVGLARALALEPEILLFDEPTAGLDPITAEEIGKLIVELRQKRAITSVMVTHDIHVTKEVANV
jgi:phospholipid/cholesterol/gamma-HCH transport system ATP-binding protein